VNCYIFNKSLYEHELTQTRLSVPPADAQYVLDRVETTLMFTEQISLISDPSF